jgi:hypothetical protein
MVTMYTTHQPRLQRRLSMVSHITAITFELSTCLLGTIDRPLPELTPILTCNRNILILELLLELNIYRSDLHLQATCRSDLHLQESPPIKRQTQKVCATVPCLLASAIFESKGIIVSKKNRNDLRYTNQTRSSKQLR